MKQDQRGGAKDKALEGSFERKNRKLLMTNYKMYLRNQPPISIGNKKLQLSYEDFVQKEELDYRIYERLKDKILETGKHLLVQQHTSESYLSQNKMIPLCWYLKSEPSSKVDAWEGRRDEGEQPGTMDQGFTEEEQFYSKNKAILEQLYLYHKLEKEEKKHIPLDFPSFVLKQKSLFDES